MISLEIGILYCSKKKRPAVELKIQNPISVNCCFQKVIDIQNRIEVDVCLLSKSGKS